MIFISGCKKTATNTVLSSVTLEIKPTSRVLPRKYGIIGMLALRQPQRCMKKGCAWRNIWQKGRQSNEKIENVLKYAMPGTRVYLNQECENNWPVLYLRNISAKRKCRCMLLFCLKNDFTKNLQNLYYRIYNCAIAYST